MTLVKHVLPAHLVLQFNCTNTVPEQQLENVTVAVDLAEAVRSLLVLSDSRCSRAALWVARAAWAPGAAAEVHRHCACCSTLSSASIATLCAARQALSLACRKLQVHSIV